MMGLCLPRVEMIIHSSFLMTVYPSENRPAVSRRLRVTVPDAKVAKVGRVKTMTICAGPKKSVSPEPVNVRRITRNAWVVVTQRVGMGLSVTISVVIVSANPKLVQTSPFWIMIPARVSAKTR